METKRVIIRDAAHPKEEELREAAQILQQGGLVAFPTETVYGLGGNALDETAAKRIYAAKGRPSDLSLIHIFAGQYADAMAQSTGLMVCITDRDQVIAVAGGPKKELMQKNISRQLEQLINERQTVCAGKDDKAFIPLIDEELEGVTAQVVTAILCEGDAIGAVAVLSREPRVRFGDAEIKLVSTAAGFLGRQMES